MRLTSYALRTWADVHQIPDLTLAELDYYFYHAKMVFHYPTFRANVEEKLRYRCFADDVRGLIRSGEQFAWQQASQVVLDRFAFLGDLDERDEHFLDLARYLLGKPVLHHEVATLAQIEHPIAWLMEDVPITPDAAALRQEDIRVFIVA